MATLVHAGAFVLAKRGVLGERGFEAAPLSPLATFGVWALMLAAWSAPVLQSRRRTVAYSVAVALWLALLTVGLHRAAI